MARLRFALVGALLMPLLLVAGCASTSPGPLTRSEGASAQRDFQIRQFETKSEERVLAICTLLLQDMGFQIDEATSTLGVLSASKLRDANRLTSGERFAVTVVSLGLLAGGYTAPLALLLIDANKESPVRIEVGITTRKASRDQDHVSVSVAFKENDTPIADPAVYQAFFDQLSKALFVEARES